MTDWIIDTLLGNWGRPALDFYSANSLPINSVVVAYGAVLVWLNVRLKPYRSAAVEQARAVISSLGKPPAGAALEEILQKRFDWDLVMAPGSGRLVAGRWRLWPTRITVESAPRLLPMRELVREAVATRA